MLRSLLLLAVASVALADEGPRVHVMRYNPVIVQMPGQGILAHPDSARGAIWIAIFDETHAAQAYRVTLVYRPEPSAEPISVTRTVDRGTADEWWSHSLFWVGADVTLVEVSISRLLAEKANTVTFANQ